MDNYKSLRDKLMIMARSAGICQEGYSLMRCYDFDSIVSYYLQNPDWCIERDYPSFDVLRQYFSDVEDKGIFVGKTFKGESFGELQAYVFHNCNGTIKVSMDYEKAVIPMLYFSNGCDIRIICEQENSPAIVVPLYVADGSKVECTNSEGCIYKINHIELIEP